MYPSNTYIVNTSTCAPFSDNDTNSISIQDLYFPSPLTSCEAEAIFLQDIFSHHQTDEDQNMLTSSANNITTATTSTSTPGVADHSGTVNNNVGIDDDDDKRSPRKLRRCRKDRHSKINTAHGPRDRRMRLSLHIARKFFGLQDLLGYDKASKTIEWLFTQSKAAIINEVARGSFPNTSTLMHSPRPSTVVTRQDHEDNEKSNYSCCCSTSSKGKRIRGIRKSMVNPLPKESREKARARARERTQEKKRLLQLSLGSWNPFGTGQESTSFRTKSTSISLSNINYNPPSFGVGFAPNTQQTQQLVLADHSLPVTGTSNYANSNEDYFHQVYGITRQGYYN